jgi:hypothetical protein
MNQTAIFWPMIAHVLLIYVVYSLMSRRRIAAVKAGSATAGQFRLRDAEPPESRTAYNNLVNQFELPVLFYAVCLSLYVTNGASLVPVALAWLFALARYVHAAIHLTSNRLRHRRPAFIAGTVILALMWLWFALHLLGAV